jgi:hypothetical protein
MMVCGLVAMIRTKKTGSIIRFHLVWQFIITLHPASAIKSGLEQNQISESVYSIKRQPEFIKKKCNKTTITAIRTRMMVAKAIDV